MSCDKIPSEYYTELENQFILRLPEKPSRLLQEAIQGGDILKNRLSIKFINHMKKAEVQFDEICMFGRLVNLPCIIESLKTVDNNNFYKTADICQMLICKEDDSWISDEEKNSKAKNSNKRDKKYTWLHGITPPLKNVRHRRFRKMLKRKIDIPKIEKEVKNILKNDFESISISWKVNVKADLKHDSNDVFIKEESNDNAESPDFLNGSINMELDENEIFGETLSVSDDDMTHNLESEGTNCLLFDDNDSKSFEACSSNMETFGEYIPTTENIFGTKKYIKTEMFDVNEYGRCHDNNEIKCCADSEYDYKENIQRNLDLLLAELTNLRARINQYQSEITTIQNDALRKRFEDMLENLVVEEAQKQEQYEGLSALLDG